MSPQSVITRVTAAHDRQRLWASNMAAVVGLQALLRGFLARRRFVALRRRHTAAVRIQVGGTVGSVSSRGGSDGGGGLTLRRGRFGFGSREQSRKVGRRRLGLCGAATPVGMRCGGMRLVGREVGVGWGWVISEGSPNPAESSRGRGGGGSAVGWMVLGVFSQPS